MVTTFEVIIMNYSYQREKILEYVLNSCEHPTVEVIYNNVREALPNISLGTVYRNLNKLSNMGKIKKISMPNHCDRFDKTLSEHFHIHCIRCDKVEDVDYGIAEDAYKKLETSKGYKLLSCNLVFDGICNDCIKEGNEI